MPQVLNLVEWPQLTAATFDTAFLKVPKEVLISEMVEHQKYFPVAKADGSLNNTFIITANNTPTDQIRAGNRKVLSARLSDGVFLYQQDLKMPIEQFNEKLKHVTYQKDLGTVYDKVVRLIAHAEVLHRYFPVGDINKIKRAALLSKADLASGMVYEFPELQGVMGRYYAEAAGEDFEVALAIDEHWMPRGENAPLPISATGLIVSLAEKVDNLIGCFAAGLIPTSSSDPYALRRQALGIIKILVQNRFRLPIKEALEICISHFPKKLRANEEQVINEIMAFFANRIKTVFLEYGFSKDEIEACASLGFEDIYDAFCKTKALHEFRQGNAQFGLLHEIYKRAKGQIKQTSQQNSVFSSDLLHEQAEVKLDQALTSIQPRVEQAMSNAQYDKAYVLIAQMQQPLAQLFDEVKIMADNESVRNNRIALLQRVFALFAPLIDFSKIQDRS
jgi:glycyl-tRNA synthetase